MVLLKGAKDEQGISMLIGADRIRSDQINRDIDKYGSAALKQFWV